MGTTESLLYDEAPPDNDPSPSELDGGRPRNPPPTATNTTAKRRSGETPQASRGRPSKPKPISFINGIVIGGPKTGKRTLLQRLQGQDPYVTGAESATIPSTVTIPYRAPAGSVSWDRIKLQVSKARNLSEKADFVVILVKPTHAFEETKAYIIQTLRTHLGSLGYKESKHSKGDNSVLPQVCICIMLNFRDRLEEPMDYLLNEIEGLVLDVLEEACVPDSSFLLQVGSTSMRNCYGLNNLHNFIYKTYLQRKRSVLEAQLRAVSAQILKSDELAIDSYEDFVSMLEAPAGVKSTAKRSQKHRIEREAGMSEVSPVPEMTRENNAHPLAKTPPRPKNANDTFKQNSDNNASAKEGERRRQFLPERNTVRVGRDALEAFLASDSEDEQATNSKSTKYQVQNINNDDDDDDFFYDESGKFNNAISNRFKTDEDDDDESDSSSDDEVEVGKGRQPEGRSALRQQASPKTQRERQAQTISKPEALGKSVEGRPLDSLKAAKVPVEAKIVATNQDPGRANQQAAILDARKGKSVDTSTSIQAKSNGGSSANLSRSSSGAYVPVKSGDASTSIESKQNCMQTKNTSTVALSDRDGSCVVASKVAESPSKEDESDNEAFATEHGEDEKSDAEKQVQGKFAVAAKSSPLRPDSSSAKDSADEDSDRASKNNSASVVIKESQGSPVGHSDKESSLTSKTQVLPVNTQPVDVSSQRPDDSESDSDGDFMIEDNTPLERTSEKEPSDASKEDIQIDSSKVIEQSSPENTGNNTQSDNEDEFMVEKYDQSHSEAAENTTSDHTPKDYVESKATVRAPPPHLKNNYDSEGEDSGEFEVKEAAISAQESEPGQEEEKVNTDIPEGTVRGPVSKPPTTFRTSENETNSYEDDDDEFFVGGDSGESVPSAAQLRPPISSSLASNSAAPAPISSPPSSNGGISAAALAAIQAAQMEAEAMLREPQRIYTDPNRPISKKPKKAKKEKKSKKEEKKKKKKKDKKRHEVENVSD